MKKDRFSDIDILLLIPQREPMIMVSGLVAADENSVTTWFLLEEGNIFLKDGLFQESGLIENIAQSAAALNGYRAWLEGGAVKNGYIGAIKNLEIKSLPQTGKRLSTMVKETHHVLDTSIILGQVSVDDQLIAHCEMNVFMQP